MQASEWAGHRYQEDHLEAHLSASHLHCLEDSLEEHHRRALEEQAEEDHLEDRLRVLEAHRLDLEGHLEGRRVGCRLDFKVGHLGRDEAFLRQGLVVVKGRY